MTKERLKSPRARLFIALDVPEAVRSGIEAWGSEALSDPALRPTPVESLHVTLCFLGYRPERDIPRLTEILSAVSPAAPEVELRGPVPRPPRGRPRLFALEAGSPETVALQGRLQEELVAACLFEPEKRPFWPHL